MYFHPLQEEIGNLSEEDISKTADAFANALNDIRAEGLI